MSFLPSLIDVLFIGHSLFTPTTPVMMEGLLNAGPGGTAAAQIINGAPLSYQREHGAGAQGVNADEALRTGAPSDRIST